MVPGSLAVPSYHCCHRLRLYNAAASTKQPICCHAPQVTEDWVKPGAVVLDVGINVREPASKDHKHRLVGDVHLAQVSKVASAISPVPGGAHLPTSSVMFHSVARTLC